MTISGGDPGDLDGLREFIGDRSGLTAELIALPPRQGTQSSATDVLSVAMGAGGAITVAVLALRDWIASMTTKVHIEVGDRRLSLETRNADAILPQVEQLLRAALTAACDDHDADVTADDSADVAADVES